MAKYFIGLDFGTGSGRAVVVSDTGEVIAQEKMDYPHGLIESPDMHENLKGLPSFPTESVFQDPGDYVKVLLTTVAGAVAKAKDESGISVDDIMGMAIDFTACTPMPVQQDGTSLSLHTDFRDNPYAYVKKWCHQAATGQREKIDNLAHIRSESWLANCGGKVNVQFLLPKILETLDLAPEVYAAADRFIEAGDWMSLLLTSDSMSRDDEKRSACFAGYKGNYANGGFPSTEFLKNIDPRLEYLVEEKLNAAVFPMGEKAGCLTKTMAEKLGLREGVAVSTSGIDAHVGAIGAGIKKDRMVVVAGTSWCHMYTTDRFVEVDGLFGIVENGILPGMYGYEAGMAAGGDILSHFVEENVAPKYYEAAEKAGMDIQSYLTQEAAKLAPGETGLLYLEWEKGNRSVLNNSELSGLMVGRKSSTTAVDEYKAMLESLAFGTYKIIMTMEGKGLEIEDLVMCATGSKNELLQQIMADVTGKTVYVSRADETVAVGAGMLAAVASGHYSSIEEAQENMGGLKEKAYVSDADNHAAYQKLFGKYDELHDRFGITSNMMQDLSAIRREAQQRDH